MEGFSYFLPISSVAVYGGTDGKTFAQQQRGLKMGADVVIATPGRLLAHMQMGYVDLSRVSFFVLDEADRMLDMGFYDDIMQVAKQLPETCQTLMFSATMPPKIQKLARTILHDPAEIKLAVSKPGENIDQSAAVCYETSKPAVLRHLLATYHSRRVIVFAASKLKVKDLTRAFAREKKYNVAEIHSDLEQQRREEVLRDFRSGRVDILIATDIVARGIDIDDISMVVNYDVPREAEDYVHRIGRTARAGADGKAVTLVGDKDRRAWADIERFLGKPVRRETLPDELAAQTSAPTAGGNGRGPRKSRDSRKGRDGHAPRKGGQPQDAQGAGNTDSSSKKQGQRRHRRRQAPKQ